MNAAPKTKLSDLSALSFAIECIARGANVAFPFGEHSPYNIIVDSGRQLYRVRAKIAGEERATGRLSVNAHKRIPNLSGAKPSTISEPYFKSEIDAIAARFNGTWYVFAEPEDLPANIRMTPGSASLGGSFDRNKDAWHLLGLSQP